MPALPPSASIALVINRPASTRTYWRVQGKRQPIETGLFAAVPGNMDYHVRQDRGIKRTVTCAVKDDHFANVTGVDADWFNAAFVDRLAYDDAAPRRILEAIGEELTTPRLARDVAIEGHCLVLLSEVARIAAYVYSLSHPGSAVADTTHADTTAAPRDSTRAPGGAPRPDTSHQVAPAPAPSPAVHALR